MAGLCYLCPDYPCKILKIFIIVKREEEQIKTTEFKHAVVTGAYALFNLAVNTTFTSMLDNCNNAAKLTELLKNFPAQGIDDENIAW